MSDTGSIQNFLAQIEAVRRQFDLDAAALKSDPQPDKVEALRVAYLGRKGHVTEVTAGLRTVAPEDKPNAGKALNALREHCSGTLDQLKAGADDWQLDQVLQRPALDVSLPGRGDEQQGSLHPVTLMRRKLTRVFRHLGFTIYDGPEIDLDFYNFSALNFPDHHPARDMQDTFFIKGLDKTILRTHTSNIQIHAMLNESPPMRMVAMGRTFRCDSDLTHTPMFHQIEGFVVDRNISFGDMKGVIDTFIKAVFGPDLATRVRPSFFPFVEPGAEFDMQCVSCSGKGCRICKQTGWLEIGGCGMIHPNVFEAVDYDSEKWTGFAFGFGLDRMAMLKYNLPDLRQLFAGDQEFLAQFPGR